VQQFPAAIFEAPDDDRHIGEKCGVTVMSN
jgi:hypothetical protein